MTARPSLLPAALLPLALAGCRCSSPAPVADAGPPPSPTLAPLLPPPPAWTFERLRVGPSLALPERCRLRAPTSRARVGPLARFVAEPRSPGSLVLAQAEGNPPALTGVAAFDLDPEGPTRSPVRLPWHVASALPRLARAGARWIGAVDRAGPGVSAEVLLWRGEGVESLGEGDGFGAVDLACTEARCALLTSRPLTVAAPGALVWLGAPAEPVARWRSVEILPSAPDGDARPLGLAALDTAAVVEKGMVVFHAVGEGSAREIARLPAGHGALEAAMLPRPVAVTLSAPGDDDGCAKEGKPGVRLVREGAPPVDYPLPALPSRAALRRLEHGGLATWIAPVGCRTTRQVVYALVLDEAGAPVGHPIPVGDASAYGVATAGDDVDLWLDEGGAVTWVRASCAPR